jgi:predicted RNase H-like HicB family nuclease
MLLAMRYTAILEAQPGGGYHASCPSLPGCHSEGETIDEAISNIKEAITVYLDSVAADVMRQEITMPEPFCLSISTILRHYRQRAISEAELLSSLYDRFAYASRNNETATLVSGVRLLDDLIRDKLRAMIEADPRPRLFGPLPTDAEALAAEERAALATRALLLKVLAPDADS